MHHPCVLCLIACPGDADTRRALNDVAKFYGDQARWLAQDQALDVFVDSKSVPNLILDLVDGVAIDVVAVDPITRRKQLFAADMDGTMITVECIDELADLAGVRTHVESITARAMAGELEFAAALRERVRCLEGLSLSNIEAVCRERIKPMPGARELLAAMKRCDVKTILISGGFQQFTGYVASEIGFDGSVGNKLEVRDNRLTGQVVGKIVDAEGKKAALVSFARSCGVGLQETMAVGDGANDVPMVTASGFGVAYRAKPALVASAEAVIRYSDLTALLFLQGYRQDQLNLAATA